MECRFTASAYPSRLCTSRSYQTQSPAYTQPRLALPSCTIKRSYCSYATGIAKDHRPAHTPSHPQLSLGSPHAGRRGLSHRLAAPRCALIVVQAHHRPACKCRWRDPRRRVRGSVLDGHIEYDENGRWERSRLRYGINGERRHSRAVALGRPVPNPALPAPPWYRAV